MKSHSVNHPAHQPLIIIRQWQLEYCASRKNPKVGAALISYFEYWHDIKLSIKEEKIRQKTVLQDDNSDLIQFHSIDNLIAGLMTIIKDPKRLKKEIEFLKNKKVITQLKNPNPKRSFDVTKHFIFHPEILNHWIKNNYPTHTEKTAPLVARLVAFFTNNNPKLSQNSAAKMIKQYGAEAIERQLEWLDLREIQDNPLRTLRAALKHDWTEPTPQVVEESWHGGELEPVEPKPVNGNKPPATEPETELQKQWAKVLDIVHIRMTQTTYDNWVKDTELVSIEGDVWMVLCPSEMVKDRLENRLATVMGQCAPKEVQLKFVVNEKSRITLM